MGLERQSISNFYRGLGWRANSGSDALKAKLAAAGVHRKQGQVVPKRVWWMAFAGEGAEQPVFSEDGGEAGCGERAGGRPGGESGADGEVLHSAAVAASEEQRAPSRYRVTFVCNGENTTSTTPPRFPAGVVCGHCHYRISAC